MLRLELCSIEVIFWAGFSHRIRPRSLPRLLIEPFGQEQRLGQVPAGLLAYVHASGHEQLEPVFHSRLHARIAP